MTPAELWEEFTKLTLEEKKHFIFIGQDIIKVYAKLTGLWGEGE